MQSCTMDLSAALQAQQRSLAAKAADVARREAQIDKDEKILRGLVEKEAERLMKDGHDRLSCGRCPH